MVRPVTGVVLTLAVILTLAPGCGETESQPAIGEAAVPGVDAVEIEEFPPPPTDGGDARQATLAERRAAALARYRAPVITTIPAGGPYEGFECYIPGRSGPPTGKSPPSLRTRERIEQLERRIAEARKRISDPENLREFEEQVVKEFDALRSVWSEAAYRLEESLSDPPRASAVLSKMEDLYASEDFSGAHGLYAVYRDCSGEAADPGRGSPDETAMKVLAEKAGRISTFLARPPDIKVLPTTRGEGAAALINGRPYAVGESIDEACLIFVKSISHGKVTLGYR